MASSILNDNKLTAQKLQKSYVTLDSSAQGSTEKIAQLTHGTILQYIRDSHFNSTKILIYYLALSTL